MEPVETRAHIAPGGLARYGAGGNVVYVVSPDWNRVKGWARFIDHKHPVEHWQFALSVVNSIWEGFDFHDTELRTVPTEDLIVMASPS